MAHDSTSAMPINSVRLIVFASSGCWAIDASAWTSARASPTAGAIEPIVIVSPAVKIETIPMSVVSSMNQALLIACGRSNEHGRQNGEDICLNQPNDEAKQLHDDRHKQRHNDDQNRHQNVATERVAEQTNGQ